MDRLDDLRLGQVEQIIVPFRSRAQSLNRSPRKPGFVQLVRLDHRAHRPVEDDDPLAQQALQFLAFCLIQSSHPTARPRFVAWRQHAWPGSL